MHLSKQEDVKENQAKTFGKDLKKYRCHIYHITLFETEYELKIWFPFDIFKDKVKKRIKGIIFYDVIDYYLPNNVIWRKY